MNDLISRQAAIEAAKAHWYKPDIAGAIEQLPSVQPEVVCRKCIFCGFAGFKQFQTAQPETEERTAESAQNVSKDDLISRKSAIDAVEFDITYAKAFDVNTGEFKELFKEGNDALKKAVERLKDLPSAQPEQKWIPCSERLPETHKAGNSFSGLYMQSHPVLVYGVAECEEIAEFHVASYCDDLNGYTYWSTELDAVTITGVKAWMPLPEPYKERREE